MNRREDLQEGKKSLVIHEGLSVFRLDTRNPKLLQIYGSPALHVDVGKRALNVDFNPDGDGDFHEVSAIRFNGDDGFSIEFNADELAPVQVTANSACNVHLLHFIQTIQDHMPQLAAAGDPDLVIEFIAVDGVLHRCELSSWARSGEDLDHMDIYQDGDDCMYLHHAAPRIQAPIAGVQVTSDGVFCKAKNSDQVFEFRHRMPVVLVDLMGKLMASALRL